MEQDRVEFVQEFLKETIKDQKNPILKVARRQTENLEKYHQRVINTLGVNLVGTYYGFSEPTLQRVGAVYGVSKERVRQVIEDTVIDIWNISSQKTKNRYPLWELSYQGYTQKLKGIHLKFLDLSQQGRTAEEIMSELGLGSCELSTFRKKFRARGINTDNTYKNYKKRGKDLVKQITNETDDVKVQDLLNMINTRNIYMRVWRANKNALVSVKEVASRSGFHFRDVDPFIKVLKTSGIPVGGVEQIVHSGKHQGPRLYRFVASQHFGRAADAFLNNHDLDKFRENPVKKICGPNLDKYPTSTEIKKKYKGVSNILKDFNVFNRTSKFKGIESLLTNSCPVPVFKYHSGYYYRIEDRNLLTSIIRKRLLELDHLAKKFDKII